MPRLLLVLALAGSALACASACATGTPMSRFDAGRSDAGRRDAGQPLSDGGPPIDAAVVMDSGTDAGIDAGALRDGGPDAGRDAGTARDAGSSCAISAGDAVTLDGMGDVAAYPSSQVITPGATLAVTDVAAITWSASELYVTFTSEAFVSEYKPLHVYLEAGTALGGAARTQGKEYGGDTPELPFTPTHVIAVRRRSDSGTGGPYNAVYVPGGTPAWSTQALPLVTGTHVFVSTDNRTISVRVPWSALGGCPTRLRLAAHVVNGDLANDWKDTVPASHMPWMMLATGYYEIDLTGDPAIAGWTLR